LVVSARDIAATKKQALEAGAVASSQKPVKTAEFLGAIQKALGQAVVGQEV
jgi:CheY-like chemotaxis protein